MEKIQPIDSPFERLDSRAYRQMFNLIVAHEYDWVWLDDNLSFEMEKRNPYLTTMLEEAADVVAEAAITSYEEIREELSEVYILGGEIAYKAFSLQSPRMPRLSWRRIESLCDSLSGKDHLDHDSAGLVGASGRYLMLGEKTYREDPVFTDLIADLSLKVTEEVEEFVPFFQAGAGLVRQALKYTLEVPKLNNIYYSPSSRRPRKFSAR